MSAGQRPELGEQKMENEKQKNGKGIEDYLSSGVPFLKALDFEINESRKYEVTGKEDREFDKLKPMLIVKGLNGEECGFVLNRTNLDFLIEEGYKDFEELYGKTVTLKKEERLFEGKFGKRKNIGLFLVKVE